MGLFGRRDQGGPQPLLVADPAYDDLQLREVRDRVLATGDWRPAAELLQSLAHDHDRRGLAVDALAQSAVSDPSWVDRWRAERPADGPPVVVRGAAEVHRAWDARGSGWAEDTGQNAFQGFFARLANAAVLLDEAVALAPDDPAPWVARLWLAIGQESEQAHLDQVWSKLVARDQYNRLGHNAYLQYSSEKWHGSHAQARAFAGAVADDPQAPGWAVVVPLQAHAEFVLSGESEGGFVAMQATQHWASPEVRADTDRALAWLRLGRPPHALALHDLSVVGYVLAMSERWAEAADVFEMSDQEAFEYPWYYEGRPDKAYAKAHKKAMRAARG